MIKKSTLLIGIAFTVFSGNAFAQELVLTDEELTRVVCNHLEQTEDTKTAIAKAYGETKNIIDDVQKDALKDLAVGNLDPQDYCSTIEE